MTMMMCSMHVTLLLASNWRHWLLKNRNMVLWLK